MSSLHQPLSHEHQLDLVSRGGYIRALACCGCREQQLPGVSQSRAMRDVCETTEEQAAHIAQCFQSLAVFEHQRSTQLCVPVHAIIVAQSNPSVQGSPMIIRIEGISSDPCSYAWYFGDVTLFLWGLIVGVAIVIVWRLISERANG